jgi:hypothetical protein
MTPSNDPLDAARAALEPGETLAWADRPDPRALARSKLPQVIRGLLGLAVLATVLWLIFLPQWPEGARGLLLAVFLGAAVLYSLWLIASPAVAQAAATRIVYAVTDRRVLILEDWPFRRRHAFAPPQLDDPQVMGGAEDGEAGRATVVFVNRKLPWWRRSAGGGHQIEAFYGVTDARRVATALEKLKVGADAAARLPEEEG